MVSEKRIYLIKIFCSCIGLLENLLRVILLSKKNYLWNFVFHPHHLLTIFGQIYAFFLEFCFCRQNPEIIKGHFQFLNFFSNAVNNCVSAWNLASGAKFQAIFWPNYIPTANLLQKAGSVIAYFYKLYYTKFRYA